MATTTSTNMIQAKNAENQALIDALVELADATGETSSRDAHHKEIAFRKAAENLAQLNERITQGKPLGQFGSPQKVAGVGKAIAYYIDEFLQTGTIAEIDDYKKKAAAAASNLVTPERSRGPSNTRTSGSTGDTNITIEINRAPVLNLWVVVVAERQGFNSREAATYGKWITATFAKAKGKSLGIFEDDDDDQEPKPKRPKKNKEEDYVRVFQHVKIPVQTKPNGDRLAVMGGGTIDPRPVEKYIEGNFRDKLVDFKEAMEMLANSMSEDELRKQAYDLYEQFRPAWKGWGRKSTLSMEAIHGLVKKS
jgi:hypothetical protein